VSFHVYLKGNKDAEAMDDATLAQRVLTAAGHGAAPAQMLEAVQTITGPTAESIEAVDGWLRGGGAKAYCEATATSYHCHDVPLSLVTRLFGDDAEMCHARAVGGHANGVMHRVSRLSHDDLLLKAGSVHPHIATLSGLAHFDHTAAPHHGATHKSGRETKDGTSPQVVHYGSATNITSQQADAPFQRLARRWHHCTSDCTYNSVVTSNVFRRNQMWLWRVCNVAH